jgi:hypothetical protein
MHGYQIFRAACKPVFVGLACLALTQAGLQYRSRRHRLHFGIGFLRTMPHLLQVRSIKHLHRKFLPWKQLDRGVVHREP